MGLEDRDSLCVLPASRLSRTAFSINFFHNLVLAASTERAFKAAFLSALSPRQILTLALLGTLYLLCTGFLRKRPPIPPLFPIGVTGLVLRAFTLAPLESLDTVSFVAVLFETFVLLH